MQKFFKTKLHFRHFKSNFQFFIKIIIFSYFNSFFSESISFIEKKNSNEQKKNLQKKSDFEFYFNNWIVNESLIVKTIKTLFQLFEKYRSFLIFWTYLNVNNSYVFIESFSRAEKNLNIFFSEKRFTISEKYSIYFISENVNSENFSWKEFLKIVSKQQKNAIVQFVLCVFSAAFVITSINIEKMLRHVTKKNSKFLFSAFFSFFQKTVEVSF